MAVTQRRYELIDAGFPIARRSAIHSLLTEVLDRIMEALLRGD
jgi:hypothetical protein